MDRNDERQLSHYGKKVALRKESVDRNNDLAVAKPFYRVALRKESVDRNTQPGPPCHTGDESLSARRAWIETRPAAYRQTARKCRSPQGERG